MAKFINFSDEDEVFKVLESQAEYGALSSEDRLAYDRSLKAYRDYNNTIAYAREEGREEGRVEGREEMKLDVARKMKAQGFKPDAIASFVDLPIERIEQL